MKSKVAMWAQRLLLVSVIALPVGGNARDNALNIAMGYGVMDVDVAGKEERGGDMFMYDAAYRRNFPSGWGVELGYRAAPEGVGSIIVSTVSEVKDVSYSGPRLSVYKAHTIDEGFSVYGKLGITEYEVEYSLLESGDRENKSETDNGGELALGLDWRFEQIGLNTEINYNQSASLSSHGVLLGLSFHF